MRTKKYWDNRYNDFCNKVLENEIKQYQWDMEEIKDEIIRVGKFYKESTENGELTSEETVLYCYINHELNLLDPIGCCYPQISNEYSSYAWELVDYLLENGREQFYSKVNEKIEYLIYIVGTVYKPIKPACFKIEKTVYEIYNRLDFIQNLQKEQFSETLFWKQQLKTFQYKVLGKLRKEYASVITFLQEEREYLLIHKEENMAENSEDFIQFLYINHHLNLLDPTEMYYPQFHGQYEKYSWEILKTYKSSSSLNFSNETEKIIVNMFEQEGYPWKRKLYDIHDHTEKMKKQLDKINK